MKEWTQSNLVPGNCWQTAIACILDVAPDALPDQVTIEAVRKSYHNALNAYLGKHHGLVYAPLADFEWGAIATLRLPGYHIVVGPTERTTTSGSHHVVVAQNGIPIWDPHPSRAGLTQIDTWGVLAPLPPRIVASRERLTGDVRAEVLECRCIVCSPPTGPVAEEQKR